MDGGTNGDMHFGRGTVSWRLDWTVKASGRRIRVEAGMKEHTGLNSEGRRGRAFWVRRPVCGKIWGHSVQGIGGAWLLVWVSAKTKSRMLPRVLRFLQPRNGFLSPLSHHPSGTLKPTGLTIHLWGKWTLSLPIFPQFLAIPVEETEGERLLFVGLSFFFFNPEFLCPPAV